MFFTTLQNKIKKIKNEAALISTVKYLLRAFSNEDVWQCMKKPMKV